MVFALFDNLLNISFKWQLDHILDIPSYLLSILWGKGFLI
jgi:hypothetical protein